MLYIVPIVEENINREAFLVEEENKWKKERKQLEQIGEINIYNEFLFYLTPSFFHFLDSIFLRLFIIPVVIIYSSFSILSLIIQFCKYCFITALS